MKKYFVLDENDYLDYEYKADIAPSKSVKYTDTPINCRIYSGDRPRFNHETKEWIIEQPEFISYNEFEEFIEIGDTVLVNKIDKNKKQNKKEEIHTSMLKMIRDSTKSFIDDDSNKIIDSDYKNKKISVLIPCYGKSKYVIDTLKSVLNNTVMPEEIIVLLMDEDSIALFDEIKKLSKLITIDVSKRKDIIESRMYLANKCSTNYMIFLDADDLIGENFIEECYKTNCFFMFSKISTYRDGDITAVDSYSKSYLYNTIIGNLTGLINKEKFFELGGLSYEFNGILEDCDFKLAAATSNYKVHFNNETNFFLRRDSDDNFKSSSVTSTIEPEDAFRFISRLIYKHFSIIERYFINNNDATYKICKLVYSMYGDELNDEENEIVYNFISSFSFKNNKYDYLNKVNLDLVKSDINFFKSEIENLIVRFPYNLYNKIEKKTTENKISNDITAVVFINDGNVIKCINSLKINNIKNIICLSDDTSILKSIKNIEGVLAVKSSYNMEKTSKIIANDIKSEWIMFLESSCVLMPNLFEDEAIIGLNSDVMFLKGMDDGIITFEDFMYDKNYCIINKKAFSKVQGFTNNYDFSFDCFINCNCDFTYLKRFYYCDTQKDKIDFSISIGFFKALSKNEKILKDIAKIYRENPNQYRLNAADFLENAIEAYKPTYEVLSKILS